MLYLSIDGGATKTIGIIYEEDRILKVAVSGPTNFRNVGMLKFRQNIKKVVDSLLEGIDKDKIEIATFALAGIKDSEESTRKITNEITNFIKFNNMNFYNDGEAAFYSRFPDGNGIIIAPGTGMVSYGIWNGVKVRSSGWGWFIDDEGGAFYIGRRAIQESVKAMDLRYENEIYEKSNLPESIREFFKIKEDRELINKIYKNKIDIREIASIAKIVSTNASKGDALSMHIMEEAARETAITAEATYNKLNQPEGIKISGYGGVFRSGDWYIDKIFKIIKEKIRGVDLISPLYGYEAVLGSMVMVLNGKGYNLNLDDINSLRKELNYKLMELPAEARRKYLFMD